MAEVSKNSLVPSLATPIPGYEHKLSGKYAGEDLGAGDACYLNTDNKIYRSTAAAANNAAEVWGWTVTAAKAGDAVTLFWNITLGNYNGSLSLGTKLYLSATNPGGLATTAPANQPKPIAAVVHGEKITVGRTVI